jgi:hypothetical protein
MQRENDMSISCSRSGPADASRGSEWLWRTKKFCTFVHHVLEEMYLLKKMDVVHAIKPLPSNVIKAVRKINAVRNAFAHSLFPENRKEHRKNKKVLYSDKDIRTDEGLRNFLAVSKLGQR